MKDIRVIGDATRDGHGDYNSRKYMVRADSPIRTIEDLKGKVLATNSIAGAMDMAMRVLLRRHGLEDKRDYQVVELDFPNQFPALTSGKIDLASIPLPFSIAVEKTGQDAHALHHEGRDGRIRHDHHDGARVLHRRAPRRARRFLRGHAARDALVLRSGQPRRRRWRWSLPSPSGRHRSSPTGSSPRRTITATPTSAPISMRCSTTSTRRPSWACSSARIDVAKYADLSLVDEAAKRTR